VSAVWTARVSLGVLVLGVMATGGSAVHGAALSASVAAKAPASSKGILSAVTTVPHSSDLWVVGSVGTTGGTTRYFEARRRHGHWQRFASPKVGGSSGETGEVSLVAAGSSGSVWVAGNRQLPKSIQDVPDIWRFSGKKFVDTKLPTMENGAASISSISASSATNAWAVGVVYVLPAGTLDALHWNGKKWSAVAFPELGFDTTPVSVSTSSPTNAWATDGSNLFHWNGTVWSADGAAPAGATIRAVATSSPKLAYAVGYVENPSGGAKTVIMRFNGTTWSNAKRAKGTGNDNLASLTIHGKSAWAVGSHVTKSEVYEPAILHTTGGEWKNQKPPGGKSFTLASVSASSAKHAYIAGYDVHGTTARVVRTFAEYFNGHAWKAISSSF
jgi:hypothetical protein